MNGRENRITALARLASSELDMAARHAAQTQLLLARASRRSGEDTQHSYRSRLAAVSARMVEIIEGLGHRQNPRPLPA